MLELELELELLPRTSATEATTPKPTEATTAEAAEAAADPTEALRPLVVPEPVTALFDREAITTSWPDLRPDLIWVYSPLAEPVVTACTVSLPFFSTSTYEPVPMACTAVVGTTRTLVTSLTTMDTSVEAPEYSPFGLPVTVIVTGKVVTPLDVVPSWLTLVTTP